EFGLFDHPEVGIPEDIVVCPIPQGEVYRTVPEFPHIDHRGGVPVDGGVFRTDLQKDLFGLFDVGPIGNAHFELVPTGVLHIVVDDIAIGQLPVGHYGDLVAIGAELGIEDGDFLYGAVHYMFIDLVDVLHGIYDQAEHHSGHYG